MGWGLCAPLAKNRVRGLGLGSLQATGEWEAPRAAQLCFLGAPWRV